MQNRTPFKYSAQTIEPDIFDPLYNRNWDFNFKKIGNVSNGCISKTYSKGCVEFLFFLLGL